MKLKEKTQSTINLPMGRISISSFLFLRWKVSRGFGGVIERLGNVGALLPYRTIALGWDDSGLDEAGNIVVW